MKDFLVKVLTIIGYKEDKEAFAEKFITLCNQETLTDLLASLPQEKQKTITDRILEIENADQVAKILTEYFTSEQYKSAQQKALSAIMTKYLEAVTPTLSEQQLKELSSFFSSQQSLV